MKKTFLIALSAISLIFSGCEDFLTNNNLYQKDSESYYRNPDEVNEALTGAYSTLATDGGANHPMLLANLLSDDCFSGGGTNDIQTIGTDQFQAPTEDMYLTLYSRCYEGIFIINSLLENFDKAVYESTSDHARDFGEAHFLRGFLYYRLTSFFGEIPLDLSSELEYLPKTSADDIYALIASDMKIAIDSMENLPYTQTRTGHANKWAAEAMMARIFMFYTGYYGKTELPLLSGDAITKEQVIAYLEDCRDNSGYGLVSDFRSLWPFSYLSDDGHDDGYKYAEDVTWAGDGSKESIFACKYTNSGDWGNTGRLAYCNQFVLYNSPRAKDYPPFGLGWGIGCVNPQLRNSFEAADTFRRWSTCMDTEDPNEPIYDSKYTWGGWNMANETGIYNKKYTNVIRDVNGDGTYTGMFYDLYGGTNSYQLWNMQDDVYIRFSDILLMHSELTETVAGINAVRARVKLSPIGSYTLDALKAERRHEFACEGIRWFDLLRWGDAATAVNAGNGVPVKTDSKDTEYSVTFNADRVFLKLPESQIRVSNGTLVQNPGWAK